MHTKTEDTKLGMKKEETKQKKEDTNQLCIKRDIACVNAGLGLPSKSPPAAHDCTTTTEAAVTMTQTTTNEVVTTIVMAADAAVTMSMTMVNDGTVTEEALVAATTNDVAFSHYDLDGRSCCQYQRGEGFRMEIRGCC